MRTLDEINARRAATREASIRRRPALGVAAPGAPAGSLTLADWQVSTVAGLVSGAMYQADAEARLRDSAQFWGIVGSSPAGYPTAPREAVVILQQLGKLGTLTTRT